MFLALGVYRGRSLELIARLVAPREVVGFDTFEGLPADWSGHRLRRGHYSIRGSLPRFLAERAVEQVAFMHVDCDLYGSTKDAFAALGGLLAPGAVVVFDEY